MVAVFIGVFLKFEMSMRKIGYFVGIYYQKKKNVWNEVNNTMVTLYKNFAVLKLFFCESQ